MLFLTFLETSSVTWQYFLSFRLFLWFEAVSQIFIWHARIVIIAYQLKHQISKNICKFLFIFKCYYIFLKMLNNFHFYHCFLLPLLLLSRFNCVRLCTTPQTAAHKAPPSLGFSRQEYWSGFPFPSPMHESEKWEWSHSALCDSVTPWTAAY